MENTALDLTWSCEASQGNGQIFSCNDWEIGGPYPILDCGDTAEENEEAKEGEEGIHLANMYRSIYVDPLHSACQDYLDGSLTNLLCLGILVE